MPVKSWGDALAHYRRTVTPSHKGARWEEVRLERWEAEPLAKRRLADLRPEDFIDRRDARLAEVKPATVRREMSLLRSVLNEAVERRWLRSNPMADVRRPSPPASRKRRIAPEEVLQVMVATGLDDGDKAETAMQRVGLAFLFALETAMRAGEIVGMRWEDVREKAVTLPATKNGDVREVPLSPRAREILAALPKDRATVFDLHPGTRDNYWRKATKAMPTLRFHDARAEGIWRLSKKLDVLELARVIGHRDLKSLLIYYNASADELADKL
jgi:integrase